MNAIVLLLPLLLERTQNLIVYSLRKSGITDHSLLMTYPIKERECEEEREGN